MAQTDSAKGTAEKLAQMLIDMHDQEKAKTAAVFDVLAGRHWHERNMLMMPFLSNAIKDTTSVAESSVLLQRINREYGEGDAGTEEFKAQLSKALDTEWYDLLAKIRDEFRSGIVSVDMRGHVTDAEVKEIDPAILSTIADAIDLVIQ